MKYLKIEVATPELHIYPFVCWHVGAKQSDDRFIKEMIQRVKEDDLAKWVYLGDGGECVTKQSKGDIYTQTMNIQEQLEYLVELLEPIAGKAILGVRGNHGNRVFKETGMGFDDNLMRILRIPYMGTSAFTRIQVKRSNYDVLFHHGLDSGVGFGTKINAAKKLETGIAADAVFSAHSHICTELPTAHSCFLDPSAADPVRWRTTHNFICGCAYDSRTGYAEDKGYPPILPAHMMVSFSGKIVAGKAQHEMQSRIWRATA